MQAIIFIPTLNRFTPLINCLDSLDKQSYRDFWVLMIAPAIDQKISNRLKNYTFHIRYIKQGKTGLVEAANQALTLAGDSDIFIRIDDDVVVDKDWLTNMVKSFDKNQKVGGVTGPTLMTKKGIESRDVLSFIKRFYEDKSFLWQIVGKIYLKLIYNNNPYAIGRFFPSGAFSLGSNYAKSTKLPKPVEVDNLEACNFSCRTKLLRQLGGFDPIFNRGLGEYNEADIACKLRRLGYTLIFNPKALVWHKVETTKNNGSRPDAFYRIFNFIVFYRRHIKIDSFDKLFHLSCNVFLQNCYYIFKLWQTGNWQQLKAISGTIYAFLYKDI